MKGSSNKSFLSLILKKICSFAVNFVKRNECNHETAFDPIFHRSSFSLTTISNQNDVEQIFVPLLIQFCIFFQKRLAYAQNLTQICWVKFPSPLKKFFTFIPNFLSDKVDRERFFSEFQFTLLKVILKPIVSVVIPVWYYAFLIE